MNWIWSLFQPFLAYSALPLPPAGLCPFPTGASHRACPRPQRRGPPAWRGPQCTAQAAGPSASPSPRGQWSHAPGQGPPRPSPSPTVTPVSASPRLSSIREAGGHGGARASVWFNPKAPQSGWPFGGVSEVRSQPTHWGRGPGAQVESLGEDMQGACWEEGGGPESFPACRCGWGGAGQQGRQWRPGCRPARSCSESHHHLGTWGL